MLFLFLTSTLYIIAQTERDAQLWQKGELEFDISRRYSFSLQDEARLTDNMQHLSYYYFDFGNVIKFGKSLRLGLDYVLVEKEKKDGFYSTRNQYNVYLSMRHKYHRYLFYNRILTEGQWVDYNTSENGHELQDKFLRDKVTLRYKLKKYLYPYVEDELYYRLQRNGNKNPEGFDRNRFYVGLLYNLTDNFKLDFFSMYENNFNCVPHAQNFVYGVGFSRTLF